MRIQKTIIEVDGKPVHDEYMMRLVEHHIQHPLAVLTGISDFHLFYNKEGDEYCVGFQCNCKKCKKSTPWIIVVKPDRERGPAHSTVTLNVAWGERESIMSFSFKDAEVNIKNLAKAIKSGKVHEWL